MARDPREERLALATLKRWMREHPSASVVVGYNQNAADFETANTELVTIDASPYDLAQIATAILERAQERFAAMVDPDRRRIALRHVSAALAALWDTPETDA